MLGAKSAFSYSFAEINKELVSELLRKLSETREETGTLFPEGLIQEPVELVRILQDGDDRYSDDLFDDIELPAKEEPTVVAPTDQKAPLPVLCRLNVVGAPDDLTDLPEEDQLRIACIKESLHCVNDDTAESIDLRFLSSLAPEMVTAIFDELETESISEVKLALLLRAFIAADENASLIIGIVFARHAVLPKLDCMSDDIVPRVLSNALVKFAETFPHVAIEGLIVPLIKRRETGKATKEMLQAIVKDGIPREHATLCMRHLIQESQLPEESLLVLIHSLIAKKGPLEGSLPHLVQWLLLAGGKLRSDMKFAKLLMDVLNLYGDQMSSSQLEDLSNIISTNATFLKRPLKSLLKKLTTT